MSRCPDCHLLLTTTTEDHAPRCANWQRLNTALLISGARVNLPDGHACAAEIHAVYRRSAESFLQHVEGLKEWNDGTSRFLSGSCLDCGGGVTLRIGVVRKVKPGASDSRRKDGK